MTRYPLPSASADERNDGSVVAIAGKCSSCPTRECMTSKATELSICSFGFNYKRISPQTVLFGFLAENFKLSTPARTKNLTRHREAVVKGAQLAQFEATLAADKAAEQAKTLAERSAAASKYYDSPGVKEDLLATLRPEVTKGLSFVHDYKQINTTISHNINVIIETKYQGTSLDEKIPKATHEEKAIYWASKFLQEKLNVAKFLLRPEWISKESEMETFRFHGLFNKYLRIYEHRFAEKHMPIKQIGESRENIFGNPEALAVIPHTFLDNALKYSHDGGKVELFFSNQPQGIHFSVSSYGPRIYEEEKKSIFRPFTRGRDAPLFHEEGAGYGLFVSQLIAEQHHTLIYVEQDLHRTERSRYWTTFSILLPYRQD